MSNTPSRFRRKARTTKITLTVDPNDAEPVANAQTSVSTAQMAVSDAEAQKATAGPDKRAEAARRLTAAKQALANAEKELARVREGVETVTFTLQALSPARREQLATDHPPTPEQVTQWEKVDNPDKQPLEWDPTTYFPAMLAASCVKVEWSDGETADGITDEEAADFYGSSTEGDQMALNMLMFATLGARSQVDLGKG